MTRWMVWAVLAGAGSLLLYPLEATAQRNVEPVPVEKNAVVSCGFNNKYSYVLLRNMNAQKHKRTVCRWKCVYRTGSGALHVNAGERTNIPYTKNVSAGTTMKVAPGIVATVSAAGSCL